MNEFTLKNNKTVTPENFERIEKTVLKNGLNVIWSSLYGKGVEYNRKNYKLIFTDPHRVKCEKFFNIDIFPEGTPGDHAIYDSLYTFQVTYGHELCTVHDLNSFYHEKNMPRKEAVRLIEDLFKEYLSVS